MATTASRLLTDRKERQIVDAFRHEGATSGKTAQRLQELGLRDSPVLRHMLTAAIVRKAGPERYFLDEDVWGAKRRLSGRHMDRLLALGVTILLSLGAWYLLTR